MTLFFSIRDITVAWLDEAQAYLKIAIYLRCDVRSLSSFNLSFFAR